ncbi:MAG: bifunctional folylpolyglutamate synthase/dihydrofolate synthase [Acidobacteria bacterium]|nr:bifunctional folylpolyglutamate synthase/dihydrofolate synthase [Acidobacteriota bacterium]
MTHEEVLAYLHSLEALGIKLALKNVSGLLEALGNPQSAFPSVLVTGTNGKGSVAAMLASILHRAGHRIGLYTSPHLIRHEERIVVDGRPIAAADFDAVVTDVRGTIERLVGSGALQAPPTHFETITAAAFLHFARAKIELAVLEVGMGGRLDATVLARPRLALATNVALEHTAYLGDTIAKIAAEKAGVLLEGGVLLSGERAPEALDAFRRRAEETGGRFVELASYATVEGEPGGPLAIRTRRREHLGLEVALRGPHQAGNAALAVAACDLLDEMGFTVPAEAIGRGLAEARWPGRFQIVEGSPRVVLDGAHNPAACEALATALAALPGASPRATTLVFGVLRDKEHVPMMRALFPRAARVVLTRGRAPRFRDPHGLLPEARRIAAEFHADRSTIVSAAESIGEALREARGETPASGIVCVAGSLYLVGEAMELLGIEPWE